VHNDPIYYGNIHFANPAGQREQQPQDPLHKLPVANPTGWNVYRVDWGCDHIAWFLNGVQLRRVEKEQVSGWAFDRPFYLILNLAVGGNLPGNNVDPAGGELLVDWIKVTAPPAVPAASG
jgi:beta-glucanase (GH16 family)